MNPAEIPDSPKKIRPLLVGAEVPPVELPRAGGGVASLAEVSQRPAVIVFYRGGW